MTVFWFVTVVASAITLGLWIDLAVSDGWRKHWVSVAHTALLLGFSCVSFWSRLP